MLNPVVLKPVILNSLPHKLATTYVLNSSLKLPEDWINGSQYTLFEIWNRDRIIATDLVSFNSSGMLLRMVLTLFDYNEFVDIK